jgi:hypothetical protein
MFKGSDNYTSNQNIGQFSSSGKFIAKGNILSLIYGDDFIYDINIDGKNSVFKQLFYQSKVVSVEKLELPSMNVPNNGYYGMFWTCTDLTTAMPRLYATRIGEYGYAFMFYGCTSLLNSPEIDATFLAASGYSNGYNMYQMFRNCSSIVNSPSVLKPTEMRYACYSYMFSGCTNLETSPILMFTTFGYGQFSIGNMLANTKVTSVKLKLRYPNSLESTFSGNWLYNVPENGTASFPTDVGISGIERSANGIPASWTIIQESF